MFSDSAFRSFSAACLSTSPNLEDLKPVQRFRLLKNEVIQHKLSAIEYLWGLSWGDLDPFSELNYIRGGVEMCSQVFHLTINSSIVRADVAQLLWSKDVALVPTAELLARMDAFMRKNYLGGISSRQLCFDSFPVQSYEYTLLPISKSCPSLYVLDQSSHLQRVDYHELPPLQLTLYPFFAATHAGAGFFKHASTRDPDYSHPIGVMNTLYASISPVPEFFTTRPTRNPSPGDNHDVVLDDEPDTDSESTFYSDHEGKRIQRWVQGAGVSCYQNTIASLSSTSESDVGSDP
ncbi:hypothetical protein D9757_012831 [Collybiopsis confluens]|uniref:Uncharacterized protein n=1 Tax=Collybiopsis confluens TaxID=2823264 RepID=A0A8H5D177_9AGAR|nr:hypothetical protein D9757_012831 [Collybiopsis confluens]